VNREKSKKKYVSGAEREERRFRARPCDEAEVLRGERGRDGGKGESFEGVGSVIRPEEIETHNEEENASPRRDLRVQVDRRAKDRRKMRSTKRSKEPTSNKRRRLALRRVAAHGGERERTTEKRKSQKVDVRESSGGFTTNVKVRVTKTPPDGTNGHE